MLVSMTGFGRSKIEADQFTVTVEIKTVNHRFREHYFRMPRQLLKLEDKIKRVINEQVSRGRVEVFITVDGDHFLKRNLQVDWELLNDYYETLCTVKKRYDLNDEIKLDHLLEREELIQVEERDDNNESLNNTILEAVQIATSQLKEMRIAEGKVLRKAILQYVEQLHNELSELITYCPTVVEQYENRLRKRLAELLEENVDETRLLTEITLFADKADISEELTRLQSHHQQFIETIKMSEPTGRKLDFLLQEMNREVNTIGSKANDATIGKKVVEMKSLLEKIKEQIQNIE